jgi:AcrR family transcriptional regulator
VTDERRTPLREAILAATVEMTSSSGWSSVTMARLADIVGVSRQTVYNEVGSKPALAQAVVLDELGRFLAVVEAAFASYDDVGEAVAAAVRGVLERADDNPLLSAIVAGTHGADTDLLPLLTTSSAPLLDTARAVVRAHLEPHARDEASLEVATDVLVRVTLSHVMAPSGSPAATGRALGDAVRRLLA